VPELIVIVLKHTNYQNLSVVCCLLKYENKTLNWWKQDQVEFCMPSVGSPGVFGLKFSLQTNPSPAQANYGLMPFEYLFYDIKVFLLVIFEKRHNLALLKI
jgi:hypothetical protein